MTASRGLALRPGAATAIGTLPHQDPTAAAAFVLSEIPALPAAPQLAGRPADGPLAQAVAGMAGVRVRRDGRLAVGAGGLDVAAPTDFDAPAFAGLRAFLAAVARRRGPIKLQLTGPLTLGTALAAGGAPIEAAFDAAGAAVRRRAADLVALARREAPGATLVVFLDERALGALDLHDGCPAIGRAVDLVSESLASLGSAVVSGVHACEAGPSAQWRIALQAGPDVLSVPVDDELVDGAPALSSFLEGGGWVAWGAVPTDRPIGDSPDLLWRRLVALWCELSRFGCDPVRLRRQALITPACGLGGHGISQAARVLDLCRRIGERVGDQATASRLSMGA